MQVVVVVRHRVQDAVDVVRNGPGRRAMRVARKGTVQIALVDRRHPRAGHGGGHVGGRQDDHPAFDMGRLQGPDQLGQNDLPLVFVTVVARHQEHRGPLAVAHHTDRNGERAIGRARHRMRQMEPIDLFAVALVVDIGKNHGGICHQRSFEYLFVVCISLRGRAARVRSTTGHSIPARALQSGALR